MLRIWIRIISLDPDPTKNIENYSFYKLILSNCEDVPGTESFLPGSGSGSVSFLPASVAKFGIDPDSDPYQKDTYLQHCPQPTNGICVSCWLRIIQVLPASHPCPAPHINNKPAGVFS